MMRRDAGVDSMAFCLEARAVIEAVAEGACWRREKGDGSRGQRIAFARYKNLATYVAVVAEIEVDRKTGALRVPRAFAAADAGRIFNSDGSAKSNRRWHH